MADLCVLRRAVRRLSSGADASPRVRTGSERLYVTSLERYLRDPDFEVHFPHSVGASDGSLFDATITDGDCRIRVTLDPLLNALVHTNRLHCGSAIHRAELCRGQGEGSGASLRLSGLEVLDQWAGADAALSALASVSVRDLPWAEPEPPEPAARPLRARRSCYLPLWSCLDWSGEAWRDTPPEPHAEAQGSTRGDSLSVVRQRFLGGSRRLPGVLHVLVLHKSSLTYYGKVDQRHECPYKAELQVADGSARCRVVLWNSLCQQWYRVLHPGLVLRLSHYRVKEIYGEHTQLDTDIEISLNSRNPSARISIVPAGRVSPSWALPDLPHAFLRGKKLGEAAQGAVCDVVGVLVFVGRAERSSRAGETRAHGRSSHLDTYRWLQLDDGRRRPITIQLFSTSQPDIHSLLCPLALIVITNLKLIRSGSYQYLTNTPITQVYCTGSSLRTVMPYRGVRPIRRFLRRVRERNRTRVLVETVVGGVFTFPPLPVSLHAFMQSREEGVALVSGGELRVACEALQYREQRRFLVQCVVTAACYHPREDVGGASDLPSAPLSPRVARQRDGAERQRSPVKRKLSGSVTPRKRVAPAPESCAAEVASESDVSLFENALEFLFGEDGDGDDDDDDDSDEDEGDVDFVTPPSSPAPRLGLTRVAVETVPREFSARRSRVQAAALGLQVGCFHKLLPQRELEAFPAAACYTGYFTLALKVLSDGVMLNAIFLPSTPGSLHWAPLSLSHDNTWQSVLSHGGFSPHAPPPSPADLIATAGRLTNQRLMCVLEACLLGGDRVELILSRAFPLR